MNRTLMERSRIITSGVGLEKKFYVELIATTCYMINMSPILAFVNKTAMEVYTRKKPSLQHLPIFCCDPYAHVPKKKLLNLDNKEMNVSAFAMPNGVKGYKLCNSMAQIFLYFRDVIFK